MKACSLIVNLPGLRSKESFPKGTLHLGSRSHARPIGKTRICATTYEMVRDGYKNVSEDSVSWNSRRLTYRRPKNWFAPEKSTTKIVIRIHARTAVTTSEIFILVFQIKTHCCRPLLGHLCSIHKLRLLGLLGVSETCSSNEISLHTGRLVSFNVPFEGFGWSELCLFRSIWRDFLIMVANFSFQVSRP